MPMDDIDAISEHLIKAPGARHTLGESFFLRDGSRAEIEERLAHTSSLTGAAHHRASLLHSSPESRQRRGPWRVAKVATPVQ